MKRYFTIKEAAEALALAPKTIEKRIKTGSLEAQKESIYPYRWMINEAELREARESERRAVEARLAKLTEEL